MEKRPAFSRTSRGGKENRSATLTAIPKVSGSDRICCVAAGPNAATVPQQSDDSENSADSSKIATTSPTARADRRYQSGSERRPAWSINRGIDGEISSARILRVRYESKPSLRG